MNKLKRNKSVSAVAVLLALSALGITVVVNQQKRGSLPIIPGAEKTRLVYLSMTAEDWKRDEEYGSVFSSVKQAHYALTSNPQDPKAHRTLARDFIHKMETASDTVKPRLLASAVAEYRAALKAEPHNPVTQYNLAAADFHMGRKQKALSLYQQVESYPPLQETAEIAIRSLQGKRG